MDEGMASRGSLLRKFVKACSLVVGVLLSCLNRDDVGVVAAAAAGSVSLEAFPTTLKRSKDTVTLTWHGIESPSALDWLGIYMPPESGDNAYLGYILLSSCTGWESGNGSVSFPAVNMRAPFQFRLFKGIPPDADTPRDEDDNPLPNSKIRLAATPEVGFVSFNEPTQVHLALTSVVSEMRVMFVTKDPLRSFARYGKRSSALGLEVEASSQTYRQSDMCDAPASSIFGWRDPGFTHDAVLTQLDSGEAYFYQVGSNEGGWSEIFTFIASVVDAEETNALLFGDMGTWVPYTTFHWLQAEAVNTMKWIKRDIENLGSKPAFVSHIGDISYARGYAWIWDEFFSAIEPIASRVPYHVCIGNHEYHWPKQPWRPAWSDFAVDGGGECGVPYSLKFNMPGNSSAPTGTNAPDTRNLYYSLNVGTVHFLYISTETNFLPGSDQYTFIAQDLQSVDREKTPFVVFLGHRPMYSTDNWEMNATITRRLVHHLEPLLIRNKVSLALWGHVHKYERTCPLENWTCMESSSTRGAFPIHMVIGMAGQDWQPIDQPRVDKPHTPIFPQPSWSLFRTFEFGYIRIHATRRIMTVSYVGNHDGQVHDVIDIVPPFANSDFGLKRLCLRPFCGDEPVGWFPTTIGLLLAFLLGAGVTRLHSVFFPNQRFMRYRGPGLPFRSDFL